jgi:nicotinamide phosphoribosyltransferase
MLFNIRNNPLCLTDGYNTSHQFLKINTDFEVSHIYNRNMPGILFGFHENVLNTLDIRIEDWMVQQAEQEAQEMGLPFPSKMWMRVVDELDGRIPLEVEALPDGTWIPQGTPFAQIRNTEEGFGECVSWWEGLLLHSSFPSACATEAFKMRQYLLELQEKLGYDDSFLRRFHSFGFRGHRSLEDAYWASTAWNLFLYGTDDFMSKMHTPEADISSIPALAHKVTQQFDSEMACYIHAINTAKDMGKKAVAVVIDTYDAERFIDTYAMLVANYAAEHGITVVFRPDSGDVINQAMEIYAKCVTVHGCKNVKVIVGMDMDFQKAKHYDSQLTISGVPLDFVSYGIGSGFYNDLKRDTLGFSMKTAFSNGRPRMKFSQDAIKQSIPGIIDLIWQEDGMTIFTRKEAQTLTSPDYELYKLYNSIYYCDSKRLDMIPVSWEETRDWALLQIDNQKQIILSQGIQDLISEIRAIYGLDPQSV